MEIYSGKNTKTYTINYTWRFKKTKQEETSVLHVFRKENYSYLYSSTAPAARTWTTCTYVSMYVCK